ncbi:MAG: indole-3-glycerol phosphate synthase TrpC [Cyclobacteriaceae bacterium]|nr:indole-3-glycerol phosphate synthase TrpC [Cyclobacteriaceae bacterium]
MNILEKIINTKRKEVYAAKASTAVAVLEKSEYFKRKCFSLKEELLRKEASGIIAEIKRKSPSQGIIHHHVNVATISAGYIEAGATALSILTDYEYFGGGKDDLINARSINSCPILRKDFIVDEYQLLESKSIGADIILLIAAALSPVEVKQLTQVAHSLGLEVLLEVHDEAELESNLNSEVDLMGVNNRNLKTFEVSLETSLRLLSGIPSSTVRISESGIDSPEAYRKLKAAGFQGFLMGQHFMQQKSPARACKEFIEAVRSTI